MKRKAISVMESETDSDEGIIKEIYAALKLADWHNTLKSKDEDSWGMLDYIDPNRPTRVRKPRRMESKRRKKRVEGNNEKVIDEGMTVPRNHSSADRKRAEEARREQYLQRKEKKNPKEEKENLSVVKTGSNRWQH